jgi:amino acid transporter
VAKVKKDAAPAEKETEQRGHGFGTAPVYLASISTILGAILFLRFGYAVAHVGLFGTLLIILLGHMVTIPTALAIAEIATNRRVEGGGEYFIISRSFGTTIGASIGTALYFSQAISVAFYMIAFAEAFRPLAPYLESLLGMPFDPRMVSVPATILLAVVVIYRGAAMGVAVLWFVVTTLAVSLLFFFLGHPVPGVTPEGLAPFSTIANPDPLVYVFSIVFPAFTGMTAGVGLAGDLANPRRSIPLGIMTATVTGIVVYVAVVIKMAFSASPEMLATDQLIMSRISLWGPIIPIGLAAATVSSAIGSILVAPRTMQALALDGVAPAPGINRFLSAGIGAENEPRNATLVTATLALVTVSLGNVDFVARIISMFFMVTYGTLCAISFLEHFAARPGYRPSFRSRWYISLLGALMCLFMMFQMDPLYAILAILLMIGLYNGIRAGRRSEPDDLSTIFRGVMTQATRYMQIRLQKSLHIRPHDDWRPSLVMISERSFTRSSPMAMLGWLCHHYGFGTYLHLIRGFLEPDTWKESRRILSRLIKVAEGKHSAIYVDTIVSPSMKSALAQTLQVPGVSGMENNTILFEFSMNDEPEVLDEAVEGCLFAYSTRMNRLVLRHSEYFFGDRKEIHIWLTWHDYDNASLMILLAYILLGHPDWKRAEIRIFAAFPKDEVAEETEKLNRLILEGRLPITQRNMRIFPTDEETDFSSLIQRVSGLSDLVVLGFTEERLHEKGREIFLRHPDLREVLYVSARERIVIE